MFAIEDDAVVLAQKLRAIWGLGWLAHTEFAARQVPWGNPTSSHTRAKDARSLQRRRPPDTGPMAGSPLKRARKAGVREIDGQVEASVRRARGGLSPAAWCRLSPVEKLQILYGLSIEAALEDLSYRGDEPHRLAARTSARHDVMMIWCAKYAIETSRERESRRLVEELGRRLGVKSPEPQA